MPGPRFWCREWISHTVNMNSAAATVTVADAANVETCAFPVASSIATSMPAPMAAAEPKTR
ncbi:hypothetical protein GCM10020221_06110 [Streptomyces thioluteus]|uniref:Uncharacterized protein n=1 Tax=Streptomyces thioluteus TaxID=66431 RepID=A0ABN3WHP6_STRTU